MKVWHFSSSVNSFCKRTCTAILWARCLIFGLVYFHTSCVRTAKALSRLRGCAGSPEPSLVVYVISTIISWDDSYNCHAHTLIKHRIQLLAWAPCGNLQAVPPLPNRFLWPTRSLLSVRRPTCICAEPKYYNWFIFFFSHQWHRSTCNDDGPYVRLLLMPNMIFLWNEASIAGLP